MRFRLRGVSAFAVTSLTLAFGPASARDLTLDEALRRARDANVRLAAAGHESLAREAAVRQANARPNPTLELDVENWAGSGDYGGFGLAETSLRLAQTFELGGKRAARVHIAERDRDVAAIAQRARRAEVDAAVRKSFAEALALQAERDLTLDLERFAERSRDAVRARVDVGGASPVEARRASVEAGSLRLDRARIERELAIEYQTLAGTWGAVAPDFDRAAGSLDSPNAAPRADSLIAQIDTFPIVAFQQARIERARSEIDAVRSSRSVDLDVAGGVRRLEETEDFAALVSVGVPLPIADRKSAGEESARAGVAAAEAELVAVRREAEAHVRALTAEIASAEAEAVTLDTEILPEARKVRDEAQAAYAQGLFRLTDVLDAERTLAALSTQAVDARRRALVARAELDEITGATVPQEETP